MTVDEAISQLELGLASGEATVEFEGVKTTYRSPSEIRSAIAYFKEKKRAAASPSRTVVSQPSTSLTAYSPD